LFYVAADGMMMAVRVDAGDTLQWGAPQALFQTMFAGGVYAPYGVFRDGQRFLVPVSPDAEVTPITVVINWTAALRE
jgi:hypothetical protein